MYSMDAKHDEDDDDDDDNDDSSGSSDVGGSEIHFYFRSIISIT